MEQHTHTQTRTQPSPQYMRYIYTCICIMWCYNFVYSSGIFSMQCYNELNYCFHKRQYTSINKKPELILIQLQCAHEILHQFQNSIHAEGVASKKKASHETNKFILSSYRVSWEKPHYMYFFAK